MAKFAQYYLRYKLDDFFAQQTKADRQKFFGALFEKDESIEYAVGEDEDRKVFKHKVYHLSLNKNIIVMRIANDTTKEVEQDFKNILLHCFAAEYKRKKMLHKTLYVRLIDRYFCFSDFCRSDY